MRTIPTLLAGILLGTPCLAQPVPTAPTLRFAGSNTVGEKLAPALVEDWFKRLGFPAIRVVEGQPEEMEIVAEGAERTETMRASIQAHGTGTGLAEALAGRADLWMASRPANAAEAEAAAKAKFGRVLEPTNEHTIALDGLRVIVHRDNRVARLTKAQIAGLFAGEVTRWSDLGGSDIPVTLYSRPKTSGTYDTFAALVLGSGRKMAEARVIESSEDLADAVASDPGGIGFVGFAYERNAKSLDIVTSCGLVIPPSAFAVKTLEYPLARRLYLYTGDTVPPDVAKFLEFTRSLDAQSAAIRAGFIDFGQAYADQRYTGRRLDEASDARDGGRTVIRDADLQELEDATAGAVRLTTTFRFVAGSDRLDSQGLADVERLAQALRGTETPGAKVAPAKMTPAKVTLIGFTQAQGSYVENRAISRQRAASVRQALEARGITVTTSTGVGPAAPVACNDDPATRALNQRVEVWVQKP